MCGGTREAWAIRRTLFARLGRRAYGARSANLFALKSPLQMFPPAAPIPLTPPCQNPKATHAYIARNPRAMLVIAPVSIVIDLKNLLLATLVIAACYSDLKPGVRI